MLLLNQIRSYWYHWHYEYSFFLNPVVSRNKFRLIMFWAQKNRTFQSFFNNVHSGLLCVGSYTYLPLWLALSLRVCSNILTSALTSSLTAGGSARGEACCRGSGVPALLLPLFPCWLSCHILCHSSACKQHYYH